MNAELERPRRRARPEFRSLGRALRYLRHSQHMLLVLVLLSAWTTLCWILLVADPILGDGAVFHALLGTGLTVALVLGGARLAFAPLRWSVGLALVWTVAVLIAGTDRMLEDLALGAGLWSSALRFVPLDRLMRAHPTAPSVRRIEAMRGLTGERELRRSKRAAVAIGAVGLLGILVALVRRPESPAHLEQRFREAWSAGPDALAAFPAVLSGSGIETLTSWPELGAREITSAGEAPPASIGLLLESFLDDSSFSCLFALEGDAGTVLASFSWADGHGRVDRIRILRPAFGPSLHAFAGAWSASDDEGVLALAGRRREELREKLERIHHGGALPGLAPAEVHADGDGLLLDHPCAGGSITVFWSLESGAWRMEDLWKTLRRDLRPWR